MLQDRWEGEDEEEVKENWYDEDEPQPVAPVVIPKKRTLHEKIAEKEKLAKIKKKEKELKNKVLTNEEKINEKLERVKLQIESDLTIAKDTFGANLNSDLETVNLNDKESFDKFKKLLVSKLNSVSSSTHYINFLEELLRELCVTLDIDDLKKCSSNLITLYNEKLKAQRNNNTKKKKNKGTSIKMEKNTSLLTKNYESDNYENDYDDDYNDFL